MATAKPRRQTAVSTKSGHPESSARKLKSEAGVPSKQVTRPASAQLVADVRSGLGVTRELFARLTGFSVRAITGWEAGRPISEPGLRRVKEMERLRAALAEGMREEFIPQWLETPCDGLGGLKPVEVLERGEADRLWRIVLLIGSGMPI
jgi:DNA-binding transcriptional regulator YiaG